MKILNTLKNYRVVIEAVSKHSIQLVVTSFGINLRAETGPQKYGADGAVI